jgi:hypothetical protein
MARGRKQITLSLEKADHHLLFKLCGVANANVTKETLHNLIIKKNLTLQLQTTGFGMKRLVNESELLLNCLIF